MESIQICLDTCDERIAAMHDKIGSAILHSSILKMMNIQVDVQNKIKMLEIGIQIVKVEKLVYISVANPKTLPAMFPKLLSKYDALMNQSMEHHKDMVISGEVSEGDHLKICSGILEQRDFIKLICSIGEKNATFVNA